MSPKVKPLYFALEKVVGILHEVGLPSLAGQFYTIRSKIESHDFAGIEQRCATIARLVLLRKLHPKTLKKVAPVLEDLVRVIGEMRY